MRDKIRFDKALTIEQMAEEAIRKHPELREMRRQDVALAIARYVSSSQDWNYTNERFNYLKDLVDKQYKILEANGRVTAADVSKHIAMDGLTPELVGFLHHQKHRDFEKKKMERVAQALRPQVDGNVKSTDEQALREIIDLYLPKHKTFDCDLTFGEGLFYKHLPQPKEKYDKYPKSKDVLPLDVIENLKESKGFSSIVIDLPDIVKSSADNKKRTASEEEINAFQSLWDLYDSYADMLGLAQIHLAQNGILVFKSPDILLRTDTEQYYENKWTADYAVDLAADNNLELIDEITLIETDDTFTTGTSLTTLTRHGKRFHIFLIFKKL